MPDVADFAFRKLSLPRCFEWNLFHSNYIECACVDMDGVLCDDWTGSEADFGPGKAEYLQHIQTARPRWLPTYPIMAIVSSRLEKYRPQTMDWCNDIACGFES